MSFSLSINGHHDDPERAEVIEGILRDGGQRIVDELRTAGVGVGTVEGGREDGLTSFSAYLSGRVAVNFIGTPSPSETEPSEGG